MTVNQLLNFAEEHAKSTDMFCELEESLILEKTELYIRLEQDPNNKKLSKQINNILEKLRIINLMKNQRLELFYQSR